MTADRRTSAPTLETASRMLFQPIEVAGMALRNRLVMPPMGTGLPGHAGHVNDETIAYYVRRAVGGVGLITVEASLIAPDLRGVGPELRLHGAEFVPGLRRLVEAVRAEGARVGIQLWHPGRQTTLGEPVAASAVPLTPRTPVPRALTVADLRDVVRSYARSAWHAREAGFDFVEIHGAHGYLLCGFLSAAENRREDEYGGSLENRARLSLEVVDAVRAECGDDFPIFFRMSGGDDDAEDGLEPGSESTRVASWLVERGVSCISVSAGTWLTSHLTFPPMSMPHGPLIPLAAAIKRVISAPIIAVGRLDDSHVAEGVLEHGDADLVALGRALIADPDWPRKVAAGAVEDVRPCIACNACVDLVARGLTARCSVNPEVSRELGWEFEPAQRGRRVMVVGSGPAGMEAARITRLRGHDVSLWERFDELGGKLDVASRAPNKGEVLRFRDYEERQLSKLGVEVHTGVDVTPELVEQESPDVVLIATGADPVIPPIPGADLPHVVDAQAFLLGEITVAPKQRVVVVGGSATGCETAEYLADAAAEVSILEMLPGIGHGIEQITRRRLLRELRARGVQILTRSKVVRIEPRKVIYELENGSTGEVVADYVAMAIGWRPRGAALAEALAGVETILVGDAAKPADFVAAVNAGADVGMTV